jgi:archaellum component FlaD/FlaE
MAIEDGEQRSLEKTPTWAVSICCFIVLVISLIIDGGLHKLAEVINYYYYYYYYCEIHL